MKENMKYLTNKYQLREMNVMRMMEIINNNKGAIPGGTVFFGDSITEFCPLDKYFDKIDNKYNCGMAGITTSIMMNFIDEGVLKYKPKNVVIMAGTNDLGKTIMLSPRDIALNMKEIVEIIHYNDPRINIYLVSPLPCLEEIHGHKKDKYVLRTNESIKMVYQEYRTTIPYEYVKLINAYPALLNKKGQPIEDIYLDGLHINDEGYSRYCAIIQDELLKNNDN